MNRENLIKNIKKYSVYTPFLVLFIILIFSLIRFGVNNFGQRRVFYYYSADTHSVATECRFMPLKPVQGKINLFVDDLILGPMTNRYRYLFAPGTKVDFCIRNKKTLYVGLSGDALKTGSEVLDIRSGVELLKFNIVKNFTKINTVMVYIDGKSVFEEENF